MGWGSSMHARVLIFTSYSIIVFLNVSVGRDDDDSYDQSSTVRESMCGKKNPFYFTSTKE